jgi:tryptophanyl-tRNA synthetase
VNDILDSLYIEAMRKEAERLDELTRKLLKEGKAKSKKGGYSMEDEIYQILQLFLANDKRATEYYEINKIGIDKMLQVKKENTNNAERLIKELLTYYNGARRNPND